MQNAAPPACRLCQTQLCQANRQGFGTGQNVVQELGQIEQSMHNYGRCAPCITCFAMCCPCCGMGIMTGKVASMEKARQEFHCCHCTLKASGVSQNIFDQTACQYCQHKLATTATPAQIQMDHPTVATASAPSSNPPVGGEGKFTARELILGQPDAAARGLRVLLGMDNDNVLSATLSAGLQAVEWEWREHGDDEDKQNLEYVLHGTALDPNDIPEHVKVKAQAGSYHGGSFTLDDFDTDHGGLTLQDFAKHTFSTIAGLTETEVFALRMYTTSSFWRYNSPLRKRQCPHPFKATVYHLAQGLKKLRAVDARLDPQGFNQEKWLYRGMRNMRLDAVGFAATGGTEWAAMSTTASKAVALQYGDSECPLLFQYRAVGLARGCSISFLSVFPGEAEFLYPPLTFLVPVGPPTIEGKLTTFVVEPQMS